jgi:hypothetical protein
MPVGRHHIVACHGYWPDYLAPEYMAGVISMSERAQAEGSSCTAPEIYG